VAVAVTSNTLLGAPLTEEIAQARNSDAAPREFSRRDFLKLSSRAAAVVGGTALAGQAYETARALNQSFTAIEQYEEKLWPYNEPRFEFLGGETYQGQKEIAIYLPGFGDMHSHDEAALWQATSGVHELLTGYVDYSNEGTDIDTIVRLIRDQIDPQTVESVTFVCRSIGGLFVLPVAAELGIPIRSLTLMASPSRLSNGDMGNLGRALAGLPQRRWLATLGKLTASTYNAFRHDGFDPAENVADGWHTTITGANPMAMQKELRTAAPINIQAAALQPKLRRVFIPGFSRVVYAATDHPDTDQTVHVTKSGREFKQEFDHLGVGCKLVGVPYDGHANVGATADYLQPWTQAATTPTVVLAEGAPHK
jgi:pimeloyl-ACP methyl ester carboxylesterase